MREQIEAALYASRADYTEIRLEERESTREAQWIYGGLCLPYVLVPALNVVTK